jgi:hypothetical protein
VARDEAEFRALAMQAATAGTSVETSAGRYAVWPASGAQLWAQVAPSGSVVGLNPHFDGPARLPVAVLTTFPHPDRPLDGSLSCWADPTPPDPQSGQYPFVVDSPDFATLAGLSLPWFGSLQVAAFARTLTCWDDDAAYQAAEQRRWSGAGRDGQAVTGFAAESFIPSGIFRLGDEGPTAPTADAIFTGHVLSAESIVNPQSGRAFWHVLVRSLGGEFDIVADPEVLTGTPPTGGVVQGTFWLSGRLVLED